MRYARKRVDKTRVHRAVIFQSVQVEEPESLAPLCNLRYRPADRRSPVILRQREFFLASCRIQNKEASRIQLVVAEKIVQIAMEFVGAGLRSVVDETAAGVPILGGKGVLDDGHFLHGRIRHGAFLRLLVALCVTKCRAVKPILRCHCLAAIDA